MFNNNVQNEQNAVEVYFNRELEKEALATSNRLYLDYSFYACEDDQEKIIDILTELSKRYKYVLLSYKVIETKKDKDFHKIRYEVSLIISNLRGSAAKRMYDVFAFMNMVKHLLDPYSEKGLPKSFGLSGFFLKKYLSRYNNVKVKYTDNEFSEYFERLFPTSYTKYTKHVNYDIHTYKTVINFRGYNGNVDDIGFEQIFFEITNNLLDFNRSIRGIKKMENMKQAIAKNKSERLTVSLSLKVKTGYSLAKEVATVFRENKISYKFAQPNKSASLFNFDGYYIKISYSRYEKSRTEIVVFEDKPEIKRVLDLIMENIVERIDYTGRNELYFSSYKKHNLEGRVKGLNQQAYTDYQFNENNKLYDISVNSKYSFNVETEIENTTVCKDSVQMKMNIPKGFTLFVPIVISKFFKEGENLRLVMIGRIEKMN